MEQAYTLRGDLNLTPFDSSEKEECWLAELGPSANRKRFKIAPGVRHLLEYFREPRALDAPWHAGMGRGFQSESDFRVFIEKTLVDRGLLVKAGEEHRDVSNERRKTPGYMLFRQSLLRPESVQAVARWLTWLFSPRVVAILLPVAAATLAMYFHQRSTEILVSFNGPDAGSLTLAALLVAAGFVCHEFGHAAAAHRFGCRRVELGVGVYIIFPVCYAELSELWALDRNKRIVVDLGGIYFHVLFSAAAAAAYLATGLSFLPIVVGISCFAVLWNFNPFFRMDGYWVASDFLGIANLRAEKVKALRRLWGRLRGRPVVAPARFSERTSVWLLVYAAASLLFLCWFTYYVFSNVLFGALRTLNERFVAFMDTMEAGLSLSSLVIALGSIAWQLLLLCFVGWFAFRISAKPLAWARAKLGGVKRD